jgi:hypothetical protein
MVIGAQMTFILSYAPPSCAVAAIAASPASSKGVSKLKRPDIQTSWRIA